MWHAEQAIDEARNAERKDRVHVSHNFHSASTFAAVALLGAEPIGGAVEERVEVVVLDEEQRAVLRPGIV